MTMISKNVYIDKLDQKEIKFVKLKEIKFQT